MKKRLLSLLLCLALTLTLLPTAAFAAVTRLKSVDIVIDLPKAGDPNEMETQVTVRSIKSGGIDWPTAPPSYIPSGRGTMWSPATMNISSAPEPPIWSM